MKCFDVRGVNWILIFVVMGNIYAYATPEASDLNSIPSPTSPPPEPKLVAKLLPDDPAVFENEVLILECTLTETFGHYNSSSLYFQNGSTVIPDEYTQPVNETTLQLNITVPYDWFGTHVYCYARGYRKRGTLATLSHQVVTVLRRPIPPNITECRVTNWSKMTCRWEPSTEEQERHTGMKVQQNLIWILRTNPNDTDEYVCRHLGNDSCTWRQTIDGSDSYRDGLPYEVRVIAQGNFTPPSRPNDTIYKWSHGPLYHALTKYLVQPNPVKSLDIDAGQWNISISWQTPAMGKSLVFRLTVRSLNESEYHEGLQPIEQNVTVTRPDIPKQLLVGTANRSHPDFGTLIKPDTTYEVSIQSIPYFTTGEKIGAQGFWSEKTYASVTTKSDVPGKNPSVTSGFFRRWQDGSIEIHWKHVERKFSHGEPKNILIHFKTFSRRLRDVMTSDTPFDVSINDCSCHPQSCRRVPYSPEKTWEQLTGLGRSRNYLFHLELENEVGCNRSLPQEDSELYVPNFNMLVSEPRHFVARKNDSGQYILLTWEHGEDGEPDSYTIFWCPDLNNGQYFHNCQGELKWLQLEGNNTMYKFTGFDPYTTYEFGISAEKLGGTFSKSSGFIRAECTYDIDKALKGPQQVHFAEEQNPLSITVVWNDPTPCKDTNYIKEYQLLYRLTTFRDDTSWHSETVPVGQNSFSILDLEPNKKYNVSMLSIGLDGMKSDPVLLGAIKVLSTSPLLPKGAVIAISILAPFCLLLVVIGIFSLFKCMKQRLEPKDVEIIMPTDVNVSPNGDPCFDLEDDMGSNTDSKLLSSSGSQAHRAHISKDKDEHQPLLMEGTKCNGSALTNDSSVRYRLLPSDSAIGDSLQSSPDPEITFEFNGKGDNNNRRSTEDQNPPLHKRSQQEPVEHYHKDLNNAKHIQNISSPPMFPLNNMHTGIHSLSESLDKTLSYQGLKEPKENASRSRTEYPNSSGSSITPYTKLPNPGRHGDIIQADAPMKTSLANEPIKAPTPTEHSDMPLDSNLEKRVQTSPKKPTLNQAGYVEAPTMALTPQPPAERNRPFSQKEDAPFARESVVECASENKNNCNVRSDYASREETAHSPSRGKVEDKANSKTDKSGYQPILDISTKVPPTSPVNDQNQKNLFNTKVSNSNDIYIPKPALSTEQIIQNKGCAEDKIHESQLLPKNEIVSDSDKDASDETKETSQNDQIKRHAKASESSSPTRSSGDEQHQIDRSQSEPMASPISPFSQESPSYISNGTATPNGHAKGGYTAIPSVMTQTPKDSMSKQNINEKEANVSPSAVPAVQFAGAHSSLAANANRVQNPGYVTHEQFLPPTQRPASTMRA